MLGSTALPASFSLHAFAPSRGIVLQRDSDVSTIH